MVDSLLLFVVLDAVKIGRVKCSYFYFRKLTRQEKNIKNCIFAVWFLELGGKIIYVLCN